MRIEQAKIYMPHMKIYFYPEDSGTENLSVSLNGEKLTVTKTYAYTEDDKGSDFYILLDISKSISPGYFEQIKNAIVSFQSSMQDQDTLSVITFGDQVSVAAEKIGKNDNLSGTLSGISNDNNNTHLFEALEKMTGMADKLETVGKRTVAVVITDGEDCSQNESTRTQTLETLNEAGIPVYGMVVKETASGAANAFVEDISDFVHETQGTIYQFGQDEAVATAQKLMTDLNAATVIKVKNSTNKITSVMQPLTIQNDQGRSKSLEVCPHFYKKDNEAPKVTLEQETEKSLKLTFNEAVLNADKNSSYKVTCGGDSLPIYAVDYDEETCTAVLTFSEKLKDGDYSIHYQNIIDTAVEENELKEDSSLTLDNEEEVVEEVEEVKEETGIPMYVYYIAGGIGAGLLLLIIILALVKKNKKKPEKRVVKDSVLHFEIHGEKTGFTKDILIRDSIIAGRSESCDLAIPDTEKLLSRQHFLIEKDSGSFYLSNQSKVNGTSVNGMEIHSRYKLKSGDVIQAGGFNITVTW